ncbi:hypothetical protein BH11PSE3_BH11PSE3_35170 [soil metagenome]
MSDNAKRVMEVSDFNKIRGCPWPDFWQGELTAIARQAVDTARAGGTGRFQGAASTIAGTLKYWDVQVTPIRAADGAITSLLSVSRDITLEREQRDSQRAVQTLNTLIMNSTRDCVVVMALDGKIEFVSPGGIDAMEVEEVAPIIGADWARVWRGDDRTAARTAIAAAAAGKVGRFKGFCPTFKGKDKWWDVMITPVAGPDGKPARLVSAGRDVTERHEAELRERLVMEELNHRVKNMLAVVQAIAAQTLRRSANLTEAGKTLDARLRGLAATTEALISVDWKQAPLTTLVQNVAQLHDIATERFRISGPEVMLGPRAVVALGLVLHELGTNAAKYGALSTPTGRIDVNWKLGAGASDLHFEWSESGGPTVSPPTRSGFGTQLVERSLADFRATVRLAYPPSGVTFSVDAPMEALLQV